MTSLFFMQKWKEKNKRMSNFCAKEQLINKILDKLEYSITKEKLKSVLIEELYGYSISEITETCLTTTDGTVTQELMRFLYIGKMGANRSKGTIEQYVRVVQQLCGLCKKELNMINSEDIQYFLVMWPQIYHVKSSTMEQKRLYLSSVFAYLHKRKKLAENPMNVIEPIKHIKTVKEPLGDGEIERIRLACGTNKRNRAIVEFFLGTGVRVSELCNIKMEDIYLNDGKAKVLGKGNKERWVYFSDACKVHLLNYLKSRRDIVCSEEGCFYEKNTRLFVGEKSNKKSLHKEGVEKVIKKLAYKSGIERLHCHLFRATYATNLAAQGVSLDVIACLLGHANLNTLSKYVITSDDRVKMNVQKVKVA